VHFAVYRGDASAAENPTAGTLIGQTDISNPLQQGSHAVQLLQGLDLTPDTLHEYIAVVATYGGRTSTTYFRKWMLGVLAHGFDREALKAGHTLGLLGGYALDPWEPAMALSLRTNDHYDGVIPFDWMHTCAVAEPGLAQQAGSNLAGQIKAWYLSTINHPGDVVDLHAIGHSRGAVVVTHALKDIDITHSSMFRGSYVRLTLLDPHPANNTYEIPFGNWGSSRTVPGGAFEFALWLSTLAFQTDVHDPRVIIPAGVQHTDIWFQHTRGNDLRGEEYHERYQNLWGLINQGTNGAIANESGVPISNITDLTGTTGIGLPTSPEGGIGHAEVPYVYTQRVVDPGALVAPQGGPTGPQ